MKKKLLLLAGCWLLLIAAAANAAVFIVTKSTDTADGVCDSDCSLREAVAAAVASPETDDVIVFSSSLSDVPLNVANGEMMIPGGNSIAILGFGADHLTIQKAINGNSRFFYVEASGSLGVTGVKLADGNGVGAWAGGGAILNKGSLLADGVFFFRNTAFNSSFGGGGLLALSDGPTVVRNSAFSENGAAAGAAFNCDNEFGHNTGVVTFINTTFDNANPNNLQFRDGKLLSTCFTSLFNSTLTTDISFGTEVLFLRNTIARKITTGSGGVESEGSNIIGTAVGYTPSANDRVGVDPALGAFQLNGGHVPTYALQPGSPAIDGGSNASATNPAFDARGFFRIVDGNGDKDPVIDIGAYEYLSSQPAPAIVSLNGQVYNQTTGAPYFRASVTVVDAHGVSHQGLTNSFGFYTVPNIPSDEYCAVIVSAKKGRFVMQVINSGQGLSGLNFTSN
jgi:CSLREA domain-containing protein